MQRHRRECPTCSGQPGNNCNCDTMGSSAQQNSAIGSNKMRPVIRTHSAPLPLTNPAFFQPGTVSGAMASMPCDPYPIPPTDQEMYNIKQHIRNSVLQKNKVLICFSLFGA